MVFYWFAYMTFLYGLPGEAAAYTQLPVAVTIRDTSAGWHEPGTAGI